jgi:xanthine dehydrogenase YagS FAD-binding subunit
MKFELALPRTIDDAVEAKREDARCLSGGTDLLPEMKAGIVSPSRLVNLKRVEELRGIRETGDGIVIGALATLTEIAANEDIRRSYRALAQACELSASPQIRNAGTIGGNLAQDSRCPYFRSGFHCLLKGGDACFMRDGENREAAVIAYEDCVHVHPSDPANALAAFGAKVVLRGRGGERRIAVRELFRAPDKQDRRMNSLAEDEIIVALQLDRVSGDTRSAYVKAMDRAVWTFALASAAVRVDVRDSRIENPCVVLGGVAPIPWREFRIEKKLSGMEWNEALVTQVTSDVLTDAMPLAQNGYKIRLARAMVKRALGECLFDQDPRS